MPLPSSPHPDGPGGQGGSYIRLGGKFLLLLSAAGDQQNQAGSILTCPSSRSRSPCRQEHLLHFPPTAPKQRVPSTSLEPHFSPAVPSS